MPLVPIEDGSPSIKLARTPHGWSPSRTDRRRRWRWFKYFPRQRRNIFVCVLRRKQTICSTQSHCSRVKWHYSMGQKYQKYAREHFSWQLTRRSALTTLAAVRVARAWTGVLCSATMKCYQFNQISSSSNYFMLNVFVSFRLLTRKRRRAVSLTRTRRNKMKTSTYVSWLGWIWWKLQNHNFSKKKFFWNM